MKKAQTTSSTPATTSNIQAMAAASSEKGLPGRPGLETRMSGGGRGPAPLI
jgi:hypothetical protein